MSQNNTAWTIASFAQTYGRALWDIHKRNSIRLSLDTAVRHVSGMTVPEVTGEEVKFAVPPGESEDTYIGNGMHRRDLSEEAKSRRDASRLTQMRREAYSYLRDSVQCGRYTEAEVFRHFPALGFPVPGKTTHVAAEVTPPNGGATVSVNFALAGAHSEADVRAKLEAQAGTKPGDAIALAAYPEAQVADRKVRYLQVSSLDEWADPSDIK